MMKIVKKTIHKKLLFYRVPVSIILIQRFFENRISVQKKILKYPVIILT